MHIAPTRIHLDKSKKNFDKCFYLLFLIVMLIIIIKSDIIKIICNLFVHLSSINLENFKDRALTIPEILEFIELHTYKFGLV